MTNRQKRLFVAIIVPIQLVSAVLTRRDMARRNDRQIRGNRKFWRVFVWLNPGNSLIYWLLARR
jgi:phage terminase large subunit-like protein